MLRQAAEAELAALLKPPVEDELDELDAELAGIAWKPSRRQIARRPHVGCNVHNRSGVPISCTCTFMYLFLCPPSPPDG